MEFKEVEARWQKIWEENPEMYRAQNPITNNQTKQKKYVLVEFPYPSGSGLHVGHAFSFTGGDVYARFKRMQGYNVLFPMGWDAFGLPTENYAIKTKQKPQKVTKDNTEMFKSQMKRLAFSFDWSREVNTTDPNYYKWTQWIFIKLFEKGLAHKEEMPINWCPSCKIGLANEEVVDGKCERCGTEVSRRNISQWVVKITDYADRLVGGLKDTNFIDKVKKAQVSWIGKSEGAKIKFQISKNNFQTNSKLQNVNEIEVFTTRPDTLYGATFMVIAPEHALVSQLLETHHDASLQKNIKDYVEQTRKKSELERSEVSKEKTGVFSGLYAINPVNNQEIPIWISDFVLATYGTGAIMSVPAHDERDFAFAKKFGLPVIKVIDFDDELHVIVSREEIDSSIVSELKTIGVYCEEKENEYWIVAEKEKAGIVKNVLEKLLNKDGEATVDGVYKGRVTKQGLTDGNAFEVDKYPFCYSKGQGVTVNSGSWDGVKTSEAIKLAISFIKENGFGQASNSYHLRDWIFSRQHYWGEPIPMIFCSACAENHKLQNPNIKHQNEEDLEKFYGWFSVPEEQLPIVLPEVEAYEPTDDGLSPLSRIPEFVKCTCPNCGGEAKRETDTMPNWAGSDWYFLRYMDPHNNIKLIDSDILKYWGPVDVYIGGDEHNTLHLLYSRFIYQFLYDLGIFPKELTEPYYMRMSHGVILGPDNQRMSKSKGNVIVPETVADKYGVDVVRMYLMFMGRFDGTMAWNEKTLMGVKRFLDRFENKILAYKHGIAQSTELSAGRNEVLVIINKLIEGVTKDIEEFGYNTAIAKMMGALNELSDDTRHGGQGNQITEEDLKIIIKLLAPFAPYMAEEMWAKVAANGNAPVHSESGGVFVGAHGNAPVQSVHVESWPVADPKYLIEESVMVMIAINGKVRGQLEINREELVEEKIILIRAKQSDKIKPWLEGKQIIKEIYVPGKMVNLVVK